ncbi:hypothetical protein GE09DRAFT_1116009 [Coniochaeta sp. 2T2.1]|nr:hypothetical protein GE09DRAFT_1116009 [Coniochaeta sp. 2T2.1]
MDYGSRLQRLGASHRKKTPPGSSSFGLPVAYQLTKQPRRTPSRDAREEDRCRNMYSVKNRLQTPEKNTNADNMETVKKRVQTLERHLGSRYSWLDDDCDSISQRVKKLENTVKNTKMAIILVAVVCVLRSPPSSVPRLTGLFKLGVYVYVRAEGVNRRINYAVARALEARR